MLGGYTTNQTEEKSVITRCLDTAFYITFNIFLEL